MLERMSLREAIERAERKPAPVNRTSASPDPLLALRPAFSFAKAAERRLEEQVKL